MRFTILRLLLVTTLTALCLPVIKYVPHVAVAIFGLMMGTLAAWCVGSLKNSRRKWIKIAIASIGLSIFYLTSIGPVVCLKKTITGSENSRFSELFYCPIIFLHHTTPIAVPLERYGDVWGWH